MGVYDMIRCFLPCLPASDSCCGDGAEQVGGGGGGGDAAVAVDRNGYESVV